EYLSYAESHSGIDQLVFHINSPGGMASGTHELAQAIKSHPKPSIALVSGMAASAAYWIASACDKIILVNELAQVGSIGVMTTLTNTRKALEQMGIVITDVYATQSSDKNADMRQFLETGKTELIQAELDELCNFFIDTVKANRIKAREDVFKGKVYRGSEAIKMGLADAFSPILSSTKPKPNTKTMSLKSIMAAVIGTKEITLSQEQFNEIVAVQEKATSQIDACSALFGEKSKQPGFDLFATIKEVVDENAVFKAAAADHAKIVTDLKTEIQSLKDDRAEDPNAISDKGGEGGSATPALTAWEKEMAAKKEMIKKRKEAAK
ncbi:MAG TPA: S49 family peptidase, partial [Pseudomonadales bacterium]|nr:S49 family peptidase [Pseudomonadales bacterium]